MLYRDFRKDGISIEITVTATGVIVAARYINGTWDARCDRWLSVSFADLLKSGWKAYTKPYDPTVKNVQKERA